MITYSTLRKAKHNISKSKALDVTKLGLMANTNVNENEDNLAIIQARDIVKASMGHFNVLLINVSIWLPNQ